MTHSNHCPWYLSSLTSSHSPAFCLHTQKYTPEAKEKMSSPKDVHETWKVSKDGECLLVTGVSSHIEICTPVCLCICSLVYLLVCFSNCHYSYPAACKSVCKYAYLLEELIESDELPLKPSLRKFNPWYSKTIFWFNTLTNFVLYSEMRIKVMLLIGTDCCCWMPVCISAFVSYAGYQLPDRMYIAAATILLPINSALNPLIYSGFGYRIYKKYFI